jgi:putative phosphoesterase
VALIAPPGPPFYNTPVFSQSPPGRGALRLGLIADTHLPERCAGLPATLNAAFAGVDLLLHAGDVGELWVLDQLSALGPVVAVHGNDDTEAAQRELPYQQLIAVAGVRLLLWHSHLADPVAERAARTNNFDVGLARLIHQARAAGASIVVFGHWHLPLAIHRDGILFINPGAIASPNYVTRQARQSVAVLTLDTDQPPSVRHVDLAQPNRSYQPQLDWAGGFRANAAVYSPSILSPGLRDSLPALAPAAEPESRLFWYAVLACARRCWSGEWPFIAARQLLAEIESEPELAATRRALARLAAEEENEPPEVRP